MSETKSRIDWTSEEGDQIWVSTRIHHEDTIRKMRQKFGAISLLALLRLWCFAADTDESGKLSSKFMKGFRQSIAQDCGCSEFDEYMALFERDWVGWLAKHNLLEKTKDGYQIVFGLVYFNNPYNTEVVNNEHY